MLHETFFVIFNFPIFSVTSQRYEIDILRESVMIGNDAIFKCSIPSFVSDFVFVDSWVDSEANSLGLASLGKSNLSFTSVIGYVIVNIKCFNFFLLGKSHNLLCRNLSDYLL